MKGDKKLTPPSERVANLRYRQRLRKWATESEPNRQYLRAECKASFRFFLETFGWLYDPRISDGRSTILPFIPYSHQLPVIDALVENLGKEDIVIEKSRAQGATVIVTYLLVWRWLFFYKQNLGIVSRSLEAADSPKDPSSIGAKVDMAIDRLPKWLVGKKGIDYDRNVSRHTWTRDKSESVIAAYASTSDVARGGRATAMFLDELASFPSPDDERAMASTFSVTNCRIIVSTYAGTAGAYYEIASGNSTVVKLRLSWQDNSSENENMFCIDAKQGKLLDPTTRLPILEDDYSLTFFAEFFPALERRGYSVLEEKRLWSPWYVKQALRGGMTPRIVAEELDIDPAGSGSRFVPPSLTANLLTHTRAPFWRGDVEYLVDSLKLLRLYRTENGALSLWFDVNGKDWRPPASNYVFGIDVATGVTSAYTSNSCISIVNRDTGVKVGEYSNSNIVPEKLAETAIALARFFRTKDGSPAFVGVEANGPGGGFVDRVLNSSFRHLYYRTPMKSTHRKSTKQIGFWSTKDSKVDLLSRYRWALTEGFFTNPSEAAIRELSQYEIGRGGKVEFKASLSTKGDHSIEGDSHGDRAIADAIANLCMEHLGHGSVKTIVKQEEIDRRNPPPGSFGERRKAWEDKQRKNKFDEW